MLFYERVRRYGKWVFLFLALAFAGSFVLGGVGAGGIGIIDLLKNNGGGGGGGTATSTARNELVVALNEAEAAAKAKPNDAATWAALAQAAIQVPNATRAQQAADKARLLAPNDAVLARSLADVYASIAADVQTRVSDLQTAVQGKLSTSGDTLDATVVPGGSYLEDSFITQRAKVLNALQTEYASRVKPLQAESKAAYAAAIKARQTVTKASPGDGSAWVDLGYVAATAGQDLLSDVNGQVEGIADFKIAFEAFGKFLELYPNDPSAAQVKAYQDQLKPYVETATDTTTTATTGGTTATTGAATTAASTG